jgi:hypothetical protein
MNCAGAAFWQRRLLKAAAGWVTDIGPLFIEPGNAFER